MSCAWSFVLKVTAVALRGVPVRTRPPPPCGNGLLSQDPGTLFNNRLWNGAIVISEYLQAHPECVAGRTVVEFGAGAGVPSLVAGKLGAALVVATDYPLPAAIATLDLNIAANFGGSGESAGSGSPASVDCGEPAASGPTGGHGGEAAAVGRVLARGHLWGSDVGDLLALAGPGPGPRFDLALLGDTLWKHDQHDNLLQSLAACLRKGGGQALVGFSHHVPGHEAADLAFFRKAEERYGAVVERVVVTSRKRQYSDLPIDVYLHVVTF